MKKFYLFILLFSLLNTFSALADNDESKKSFISKLSNTISSSIEGMVGGEGDTEFQITGAEDYKPEFTILAVRPISLHPEVDAWFVQMQLNETKIRGNGRLSVNAGLGYRKLSANKNAFSGGNIFVDYDEEGNARASLGLELRSSAFETFFNYYSAISGDQTVGSFTERVLDGYEFTVVGELPYLPWANLVANHYHWEAEKNTNNSEGDKVSLELTLTQNFIIEAGHDNNNNDGDSNFVKAYLVFPGKDRPSASTNFIGESAFSNIDMSGELLSKVRRTNKVVIESEGTGVVMSRGLN